MAKRRRYQLLCPIARALDHLGDRWTLLILRDLHAGPAGFNELQGGLKIASNLLSTRLADLQDDGLIERDGDRGAYRLTGLGAGTRRIISELARYGRQLDEPMDPRQQGNLRTVYLPMLDIFEATPTRPELTGVIDIDGERFAITLGAQTTAITYNDEPGSADTTISTTCTAAKRSGIRATSATRRSAQDPRSGSATIGPSARCGSGASVARSRCDLTCSRTGTATPAARPTDHAGLNGARSLRFGPGTSLLGTSSGTEAKWVGGQPSVACVPTGLSRCV